MDENLLLEHKLIEIDYCKPVPGGLLIYLSGQIMNGKPVGIWRRYDDLGNFVEETNIQNIFHQ